MGFSEVVQSQDALWDYGILVTSLEREWENLTLAQLYRDRGDAENTFDELKTEEPMGLGRVRNSGSQAHADHRPNDGNRE